MPMAMVKLNKCEPVTTLRDFGGRRCCVAAPFAGSRGARHTSAASGTRLRRRPVACWLGDDVIWAELYRVSSRRKQAEIPEDYQSQTWWSEPAFWGCGR